MTILFDLNHPAHVHYFKHAIRELESGGNQVIVVARDKEIAHDLLKEEGIIFISRGKGSHSLTGKFFYHFYALWILLDVIGKHKVDLIISFMHPYPAQAACIAGIPSLVFSDTENADLHHKTTVPFATEVHTPSFFKRELGVKQKRFHSFMELGYLNETYFKPDRSLFDSLDTKSGKKRVFVRFVSRASLHDRNHKGLSVTEKEYLVNTLSDFFEVYISSEVPLPDSLKKYRLKIAKSQIHDFMHFCDLVIGESATMSAESALLGTPAIYIDDEGRGYTDYLEKKYGLIFRVQENLEGVKQAIGYARRLNKKEKKSWPDIIKMHRSYLNTTDYILDQIHRFEKAN